jgi:hypothetical protein
LVVAFVGSRKEDEQRDAGCSGLRGL